MASSDGWYLVGPLVAVALLALLAALLGWNVERGGWPVDDPLRDGYTDGLAIFGDRLADDVEHGPREDYGLLTAAALTDDLDLAEDVRGLLAAAGIRATYATHPDGRVTVLVFPEEVDEARRLVGGSPAV